MRGREAFVTPGEMEGFSKKIDRRISSLELARSGSTGGSVGGGTPSVALDDLTDVDAPAPDDGDLLTYDDGSGKWAPLPPAGRAMGDLSDVNLSSVAQGDILYRDGSDQWVNLAAGEDNKILKLASGVPAWGSVPSGAHIFLDTFADASIYWAWLQDFSGAGKSITEGGGVLTFTVTNGTDARIDGSYSRGVAAGMGLIGLPCIVETKINTACPDLGAYGILFRTSPGAFGTAAGAMIERYKNAGASIDRIQAAAFGTAAAATANVTNAPIWMRIRFILGYRNSAAMTTYMDYSTDGVNWTNLYASTFTLTGPGIVELFIRNVASYPAMSIDFEYFKMWTDFGPG